MGIPRCAPLLLLSHLNPLALGFKWGPGECYRGRPPHPSSPSAMPPSPLGGEGFWGAFYRLPPSGGKLSSEARLMRGRLGTSAPTSSSPAPYPSLPPERRKLAHFAASPLPNKAFGFAGGPIGFVAHTMQGPGGLRPPGEYRLNFCMVYTLNCFLGNRPGK